jgi:hypothetical protein
VPGKRRPDARRGQAKDDQQRAKRDRRQACLTREQPIEGHARPRFTCRRKSAGVKTVSPAGKDAGPQGHALVRRRRFPPRGREETPRRAMAHRPQKLQSHEPRLCGRRAPTDRTPSSRGAHTYAARLLAKTPALGSHSSGRGKGAAQAWGIRAELPEIGGPVREGSRQNGRGATARSASRSASCSSLSNALFRARRAPSRGRGS